MFLLFAKSNIFVNKITLILILAIISGCSSQSRVQNSALTDKPLISSYSQKNYRPSESDIAIFLSFSGGGTRAAAFSYGVLEALRDTSIRINHIEKNLLSEVDVISSVSGGSFTSAYYGLYGNKIFDDFEEVFLKKDIQKSLISGLLNPFSWIKFTNSGFDRTELAIDHYDKTIFEKKTFADFREDMPFIQINATDLNSGQPFIFKQEYFDLLCSDLSNFKVARAVTASSAVPVAFAPIALKNHNTCDKSKQLEHLALSTNNDNFRLHQMKQSLNNYGKKEDIQYVHLVDGGIADNLGIRVLYDTINLTGGISALAKKLLATPPKYLVIIVVNAAVSPEKRMNKTFQEPSLSEQIEAISDAQIHRYNTESIQLLKESLNDWAVQLSNLAGYQVRPFFINISFDGIQDKTKGHLINNVSTSLALPSDQIDGLRKAARHLLNQSHDFQLLLNEFQ